VRWESALSIRLDKSGNRLDEVDTERPCSLKTLLSASPLAALLAHTHNLKTRPSQPGAPRTEAPLPPGASPCRGAVSCQPIAEAGHLKGAVATRRWEKIAEWLTHSGQAPNWRRRPSVLDQ
jgi:hypothetical protein